MTKPNDYPPERPVISRAIKHLSLWHCEHCGHSDDRETGYMLTIHHLNGNKRDCRYQNLVALCQRCHLRIQHAYIPVQMFMFDAPAWAVKRGLSD